MSARLFPEKNIVYFDLETQKSADEVGGWNNVRDMRMSVGVTYSTTRGDYKIYGGGGEGHGYLGDGSVPDRIL